MAHPSLNFVRNVNKQIMIPEGHTIEDIKKREQIIRDFYREWKKKSISRQCEMLNFCPVCVAEVYALRCDAMRAGTSRYPLHRPTTTYCFKARNRRSDKGCHPFYEFPYDPAKICSFSCFTFLIYDNLQLQQTV